MKTRRGIVKDEKGFTGLEAAIVLTAFIVVAAVFSYMVLGAGFFSTEKAKAVVHTGVEKATSSAEVAGDVIGHGWQYNNTGTNWTWYYYYNYSDSGGHTLDSTNLTVVEFQVQLTAGQSAMDMNKVVISYSDSDTYVPELTYASGVNASKANFSMTSTTGSWNYTLATTTEMGKVNMLDPNEKMTVIVGLPDYGVTAGKSFKIDFKPALGGTITISKTAPGAIDKTMLLTS
ncbi:MAG: flagellin [Methanophagales archaeon]|nr:flagellin [Methanophagales archaeon]